MSPRLLVAHHSLGAQSMSKRAGAASTKDKSETGSGQKRQRADWPPSPPGEKFSYTFTGQETLGLSANKMLKVAGRPVKGMCEKGSTATLPKKSSTIILTVTTRTIFSRVQPSIAWLTLSLQQLACRHSSDQEQGHPQVCVHSECQNRVQYQVGAR